jgi:class 3 adenylate cyclase
LNELLDAWNDPANQMAGPQQVTFLLTDIVGSTALTSQIGNAGAQRVVRAHNAIARTAAKAFKGREVKHTGDGMLLLFPDPAGAARAAMDIQQEATNYAKDNPTAPLVLRVGVHQGDAVFEDGDYYGAAVSVVNGVTGAIGNTEIGCTAAIRKKVAGAAFRFEDLGIRTLKGSPTGIELFKLLWEPKRSTTKTVLEYRQIGTAPADGSSSS